MRIKTIVLLLLSLVLFACAYFFGLWGYFGLFLGEPNEFDYARYKIMFGGGILAAITGFYILLLLVAKFVRRR